MEHGVLFEWFPSRAPDCLTKMFSNFQGQLQSDGYAVYEMFYAKPLNQKLRAGVKRAGGWAHARRKFDEAREESLLAARMLADVQSLYRIESALRDPQADADLRLATSQSESLPILRKIQDRLKTAAGETAALSFAGQAYAFPTQKGLTLDLAWPL